MAHSAVVLLSGGLDSATALAWAIREGFDCLPLSFRYGQRHAIEIESACTVARKLGTATPRIIDLDPAAFQGSSLTGTGTVPRLRSADEMESSIPSTYVPARNTIFLAYALGLAESSGASDIVIGVTAVDYSGYPDCRPEFIAAFQNLANLATRAGIEGSAGFRIHTPLIDLSKAEIIQLGLSLGVDYRDTHSCYDPAEDGGACGECDSCALRRAGFETLLVPDPTRYAEQP